MGEITYSNLSKAYVQDWRRVMPTADLQKQYNVTALPTEATAVTAGSYYYNWAPSSDAKWNDVTAALAKAMNKTGNYELYINSLCGYFVDGLVKESYLPLPTLQLYYEFNITEIFSGNHYTYYLDDKYSNLEDMKGSKNNPDRNSWGPYYPTGGYKGNIGAYASWINNLFYNHLLTLQANGTLDGTKGTGIVMMDRVSSDVNANAAGYYIPRIILSNNEFKYTTTPSANGLSITVATEEINSDNSDDYKFAAPEKR